MAHPNKGVSKLFGQCPFEHGFLFSEAILQHTLCKVWTNLRANTCSSLSQQFKQYLRREIYVNWNYVSFQVEEVELGSEEKEKDLEKIQWGEFVAHNHQTKHQKKPKMYFSFSNREGILRSTHTLFIFRLIWWRPSRDWNLNTERTFCERSLEICNNKKNRQFGIVGCPLNLYWIAYLNWVEYFWNNS